MIKTVTDSHGVKWIVKFNFMRARIIRSLTGFDFFDAETGQQIEKGELSPEDVSWYLNAPQAERLKIPRDEFFDRFDDLEILDASADVLTDFFQRLAATKNPGAAQNNGGPGLISGDSPPALKSRMSRDARLESSLNEPTP